jgi:DNA repair protein RecN (Recombination protein N)
LFVAKEQTLEDTKTVVKTLSPDERVQVIAEMISSDEITDEAINNARRLINQANE